MIRLVIAVFLCLFALLTLFRAPTNFLWKVSVAINEFPFVFMGFTIVLTIWGWWATYHKVELLIIHLIALILFSLPIIRTYSYASSLASELELAFGKTNNDQHFLKQPFSFWSQFSGISEGNVDYTTVIYKSLPEKNLTFDYYPAQTKEKAPCVIVIHGGSWQEGQGDSQQLPDLNSYLANQGIHVVSMNYRLAPTYHYPSPVEDFNSVLAYINTKATEWVIDTANIVILGRSAGGQIALQAAYTQQIPAIKGVISFYAPADMAWGARIVTNKLVLDADKVLSEYIGGSVSDVPDLYDTASAPPFVNKNTPPTLLIHGPIDPMVSYHHSTRLKKKLDEFNVPNYLLDLPTSTHGCDYNFSGPSGQVSTFAIERFIRAVTK